MTEDPTVDVVIPVHVRTRPIARAVASVLTGTRASARVTVVCHNVATRDISDALGPWAEDTRVRLLGHADTTASPAGPINAGLDAATAKYTSLLGSDDEYAPGAVDAWLHVAQRDRADAVIPELRVNGKRALTPPKRPFRNRRLDGVRDRLSYRTVQLGLVSRERFGQVRMDEGLVTGEDVVHGIAIWFGDGKVSYARGLPGYVINADATDGRASTSTKPAAESLRFLDSPHLGRMLSGLDGEQRTSLAVKLLRTHLMDVLAASLRSNRIDEDAHALRNAAQAMVAMSAQSLRIMSIAEVAVVNELLGEARPEVLLNLHPQVTNFRSPAALLPASPRFALHREAMPRFLAAHLAMRITG